MIYLHVLSINQSNNILSGKQTLFQINAIIRIIPQIWLSSEEPLFTRDPKVSEERPKHVTRSSNCHDLPKFYRQKSEWNINTQTKSKFDISEMTWLYLFFSGSGVCRWNN